MVAKPLKGLVLVSGPSRGGKSRWAEHLVAQHSPVSYVATSDSRPEDNAWQERILLHRERRPSDWEIIESGADLSMALNTIPTNHTVLVLSLIHI